MGSLTQTWVAGDDVKVYEALSHNGALNQGGETNAQCAARMMKMCIEDKVLNYFRNKDSQTAINAATGVTVS